MRLHELHSFLFSSYFPLLSIISIQQQRPLPFLASKEKVTGFDKRFTTPKSYILLTLHYSYSAVQVSKTFSFKNQSRSAIV